MVRLDDGQHRHDGDNDAQDQIDSHEEDVQTARRLRCVVNVEKHDGHDRENVERRGEEDQPAVVLLAALFAFAHPVFIPAAK